jgi:hypothetical protein
MTKTNTKSDVAEAESQLAASPASAPDAPSAPLVAESEPTLHAQARPEGALPVAPAPEGPAPAHIVSPVGLRPVIIPSGTPQREAEMPRIAAEETAPPEPTRRLDEAPPGGRFIKDGRVVNAWGEPLVDQSEAETLVEQQENAETARRKQEEQAQRAAEVADAARVEQELQLRDAAAAVENRPPTAEK